MGSILENVVMIICQVFSNKRAFNFLGFFMAIAIFTGLIVLIINPDFKSLLAGVSEVGIQGKRPTGIMLVLEYVLNNGFKVPLGMFVLSLVPIGYLYLLQPSITTGLLGGLLMGVAVNIHTFSAMDLAISALPHTVVEMYAYAIWASALFDLNKWVRDKLLKKSNQYTFIEVIQQAGEKYILAVVPLIVIGAFLETYVADWIMNLLS